MEEVDRQGRTVLQVQVEEFHYDALAHLHRLIDVGPTLALV